MGLVVECVSVDVSYTKGMNETQECDNRVMDRPRGWTRAVVLETYVTADGTTGRFRTRFGVGRIDPDPKGKLKKV